MNLHYKKLKPQQISTKNPAKLILQGCIYIKKNRWVQLIKYSIINEI